MANIQGLGVTGLAITATPSGNLPYPVIAVYDSDFTLLAKGRINNITSSLPNATYVIIVVAPNTSTTMSSGYANFTFKFS